MIRQREGGREKEGKMDGENVCVCQREIGVEREI
jgi:hypothetical protein